MAEPLPATTGTTGLGGPPPRAGRPRRRARRAGGLTGADGTEGALDPFQAEVARIALLATESWSFALAGGNALVAHGLLVRPTQDVDLFTTSQGGPGQAAQAVTDAPQAAGLVVTCDVAPDGDFVRLQVSDVSRSVVVDLARDWRAHPPVRMSVGLVLHRDDAVSSKLSAMVGRGLPRDFIDVAAVLPHYDRAVLLTLLFERDPGLRPDDLALAMRQLDLLRDEDFAPYGLDQTAVASLRTALGTWPRDSSKDVEARRFQGAVNELPPEGDRSLPGGPS